MKKFFIKWDGMSIIIVLIATATVVAKLMGYLGSY